MKKVMLFSDTDHNRFVTDLNAFIANKTIVDIKYESFPITTQYSGNGIPQKAEVVDRALVIYEV